MRIGIIGGGMMGLATAFYLAKAGVHVTVFEKEKTIGGLSQSQELLPGLKWDRFYHVILSTDYELLNFLGEIGLSSDVRFTETRTGFYTDGELHSMSNTLEFLRFKPLSLSDKVRLGTGIFYASRVKDWKRLEAIDAKKWLIKVFGKQNFERLWNPLLRSKLGSASNRASASFIWSCINRYYGTRRESSKKEMMGCVKGGYHEIIGRIRDKLLAMGASILSAREVKLISSVTNGQIRVRCNDGGELDFDRVVATIPNPEIIRLWPDMPDSFRVGLGKVEYLSLICGTMLLQRPLSPFYVTNLTDSGFPFTGLIDATHIVPKELLKGKSLVYLPRYVPAGDEFFYKPDQDVMGEFLNGLVRIFPDLSRNDILAESIARERYVQPIQVVHYSRNVIPMETPLRNLYVANTTMIVNSTLNNNEVIKLAQNIAGLVTGNGITL